MEQQRFKNLTKQEIRERGLKFYYICIDGENDDKFARCENIREAKKAFRWYDNECDGDFEPILVKYDVEMHKGKIIENWSY